MAMLTKSNVWNHFTKINENECTCNICEEVVKVKQRSTTNLHNHLKRRRGKSVELCTPKSQKRKYNDEKLVVGTTSSSSSNDNASTTNASQSTLLAHWTMISKNSDRHKRITKAIARYIALYLRPL